MTLERPPLLSFELGQNLPEREADDDAWVFAAALLFEIQVAQNALTAGAQPTMSAVFASMVLKCGAR